MSTRTLITLLLTGALSAPSVMMVLNSQLVLEEGVKRVLIALVFSVCAVSIVNSLAMPSPESRRRAQLEAQQLEVTTHDTYADASTGFDDPFGAQDPFALPGDPSLPGSQP